MNTTLTKKYLSACGKLILHRLKDDSYIIMNLPKTEGIRLNKEEFLQLEVKQIKTDVFSNMVNDYHKSLGKVKWKHDGQSYQKLPNFEIDNNGNITNYTDLPLHQTKWGLCYLVYYWGKVYYLKQYHNKPTRGQLLNYYTNSFVQWTSMKNCAPIKNCSTKSVI